MHSQPPVRSLTAYDAHAEGEPGRVIVAGVDDPPGAAVYDKMVWLRDHDDGIRKLMLREPRGYPALCANIVVSPTNPEADAGFIIMEQTEYPAMSGTNRRRTTRDSPPIQRFGATGSRPRRRRTRQGPLVPTARRRTRLAGSCTRGLSRSRGSGGCAASQPLPPP